MYDAFVKDSIGRRKITDIHKSDIRAYYNSLHEVRGLTAHTIDIIQTVLHQVFDVAVDDELIRVNPTDKALTELKQASRKTSCKKRFLTIEEQQIFERYVHKSKYAFAWYPLVETLLWTGMRIGELTGLQWKDINFKQNYISVNHTLVFYSNGNHTCKYSVHKIPKTVSGIRNIPMLPRVKEALQAEKKYLKEAGLTCKAEIDGYNDFVFLNRFGQTLNEGTVNKVIKRILRDCNLELIDCGKADKTITGVTCHVFRHTFATRLEESGLSLKAIKTILGHSMASDVTLSVYVAATNEYLQEQMTLLNDHYPASMFL